jgi:hypothetical protein
LHLRVEKTIYETLQEFPSIVKRSEINVHNIRRLEISPVENAINSMLDKISDLNDQEYKCADEQPGKADVNNLTLVLQSAVDSPVNGGIGIYRNFFTQPEYAKDPLLPELESAFLDYTLAVFHCLNVLMNHTSARDALRPFSDSLQQLFHKNYAQEINKLKAEGRLSTNLKPAERRKYQTHLARTARLWSRTSLSTLSHSFTFHDEGSINAAIS